VLLLAELHPKAKREKLTRLISEINNFDGYDIPHRIQTYPLQNRLSFLYVKIINHQRPFGFITLTVPPP
jgi:hypothetical protein